MMLVAAMAALALTLTLLAGIIVRDVPEHEASRSNLSAKRRLSTLVQSGWDTAVSSYQAIPGKIPISVSREMYIAGLSAIGIAMHLILRYLTYVSRWLPLIPLLLVLVVCGLPILTILAKKLWAREFGSDLLAAISILTSVLLGQYLVADIIVLMLSGGGAMEQFATRKASSVLDALAKRMPQVAHRKHGSVVEDVPLERIRIGDCLVVLPHEICPVDGVVVAGRGVMDESYLTGEPFEISKTPGSKVLSGAINGEVMLTIKAERLAVDSRYAKIMQVMELSQQRRPRLRRIGDRLGAWYTPIAVGLAAMAWVITGDATRFLEWSLLLHPVH